MNHDVNGILDDARHLDRLASGGRPDDPAAALLADLRGTLELPRAQHFHERQTRRRLWSRGVAVAALATAIPLAGITGAAAAAHPGDALYAVRRTVIGRTADDPWAARQLVEQARKALPQPDDVVASSAQVRRAEVLLAQARASVRDLGQSDAQELSRRIGHLEHRIREASPGTPARRKVTRGRHDQPSGTRAVTSSTGRTPSTVAVTVSSSR